MFHVQRFRAVSKCGMVGAVERGDRNGCIGKPLLAPNGNYTAVATATDTGGANSMAQVSLVVDNQTPVPIFLSVPNGAGPGTVYQDFQVQLTSPHMTADISGGQVQFQGATATGMAVTCTVLWSWAAGQAVQLSFAEGVDSGTAGSGGTIHAPYCQLSLGGTLFAGPGTGGNGSNQVSISLKVQLGMNGPVAISANGANASGLAGPMSALSTFTVTQPVDPTPAGPGVATVSMSQS